MKAFGQMSYAGSQGTQSRRQLWCPLVDSDVAVACSAPASSLAGAHVPSAQAERGGSCEEGRRELGWLPRLGGFSSSCHGLRRPAENRGGGISVGTGAWASPLPASEASPEAMRKGLSSVTRVTWGDPSSRPRAFGLEAAPLCLSSLKGGAGTPSPGSVSTHIRSFQGLTLASRGGWLPGPWLRTSWRPGVPWPLLAVRGSCAPEAGSV